MSTVYLSLGSNSGDRKNYIRQAIKELGMPEKISSIYETEAWGGKTDKKFLNAALEIKTSLNPFEYLDFIHKIEKKLGRNRKSEMHWGDRTADIDILFFDDLVINTKTLVIPHPYIAEREFVLVPLSEIAPDFIHPVYKKSIKELLLNYQKTLEK